LVSVTYDHVHLYSNAVTAAALFYEEIFGAKRIADHPDGRIDLLLGAQKVFISPAAGKLESRRDGVLLPIDHIGFVVQNLKEFVDELKTKTVVFTQELTTVRPGVHVAFILGPENVLIELIQRD
jgi:catechol 2,3-dioxygenase-like lactoylglutathione lyase family enzyme